MARDTASGRRPVYPSHKKNQKIAQYRKTVRPRKTAASGKAAKAASARTAKSKSPLLGRAFANSLQIRSYLTSSNAKCKYSVSGMPIRTG